MSSLPGESHTVEDWIPFAKQHKENAVKNNDRGDIPPTVIVEKKGKIQMIVMANQVDKQLGLQATAVIRTSIDPDAVTLIMDAHVASMKPKEGQTAEEVEEEFKKKFPPGSMQKMCDEEGACDAGLITDCLICYRIDRDKKMSLVTLPYAYHGKEGPPFKWLDSDDKLNVMLNEGGQLLKGYIPESLLEIMDGPVFHGNETKRLKEFADSFPPEEREERIYYHTARAIMAMLTYKKFLVVDFVSGTHPEWTGAKDRALSLIEKMCEDGFFPQEAAEPCNNLINECICTREFQAKFSKLLEENSYWLPCTVRDQIEKFAYEFETVCVSPMMPKFDDDGRPINPYADEDEENDDDDDREWDSGEEFQVRRVKVWNGDQSEYLGEGDYVGNVKVYFVRMEDGSIQSNRNAEEKPDPANLPEGADIIKAGKNPKIVLDNGETVYGCQVWWQDA